MRFYLIILGVAISLYASLPYMRETMQGSTKPRLATWLTWTVTAAIGATASLLDHQYPAAIFVYVTALECGAIVILGYNHGDRRWDNIDIICLSGAIMGVCALFILSSPLIALAFVILVNIIGSMPTFENTWHKPNEENRQTIMLFLLSELIILAVLNYGQFTSIAYPLFYLLEDATLIGFMLLSPHRNLAAAPAVASPAAPPTPVPPATAIPADTVPANSLPTHAVTPTPMPKATPTIAGPPSATYSLEPVANKYGWNNSEVVITFRCTNSSTTIKTEYCTPPVKVSKEGSNQRVTGTAIDSNGATARVVASVNIDFTPPQISNLTLSANPIQAGQTTHISMTAVDTLAGVLTGEYYVGKTDPGAGKGHAMKLQGNILSNFLRYDWQPGTYELHFRAQDFAGNWSDTLTTNLVIQPASKNLPTVPSAQPAAV